MSELKNINRQVKALIKLVESVGILLQSDKKMKSLYKVSNYYYFEFQKRLFYFISILTRYLHLLLMIIR